MLEPSCTIPQIRAPLRAFFHHLPCCDYADIWRMQKQLTQARICAGLEHDLFLLLEHQPVMTLGRGGGLEHLLIDPDRLAERGVALYQTERGGEITYHGPGQLVVYGICDLHSTGLSVRSYIAQLEQVMLGVAADWGVSARTDARRRGVWVGAHKLGSVGIGVKRGVTFHGLALNVDLDLTPFSWISPCGLPGVEMTSLALACGARVPMKDVRHQMVSELQRVFGFEGLPWQECWAVREGGNP